MKHIFSVLFIAVFAAFGAQAQTMKSNSSGQFFKHDSRIARDHNVCKKLTGDVLIYAIFVDTETGAGWTNFDIETTLDSLKIVKAWLEERAKDNEVKLRVKIDHGVCRQTMAAGRPAPRFENERTRRGYKRFNFDRALGEVLREDEGVLSIVDWGDEIVRTMSGLPNKERLIAQLRDKHFVESVALLYMLNNYYKDDVLAAFNTMSNEEIEFAVSSYKYPSYMTNIVLHLFGAASLFYHEHMSTPKGKKFLMDKFKTDIMAHPELPINTLTVGPITSYLIGWTESKSGKKLKPEEEKAYNEGPIPAKNRGDYRKRTR